MTDNAKRETLSHTRFRRDAEWTAQNARERGRTNVVVTGVQGAWKVRADRNPTHEQTGGPQR